MTPEQAQVNGGHAASFVVLTFQDEITPRDNTFNGGVPFKEVTWHNVWSVGALPGGLHVQFEQGGPEYVYPWHTMGRIKIQRFN